MKDSPLNGQKHVHSPITVSSLVSAKPEIPKLIKGPCTTHLVRVKSSKKYIADIIIDDLC